MADPFDDVRHAALELRESDPDAAVRTLRRVSKLDSEAAVLAHAALGEILLDDFEDFDGAAHHFREALKKAPTLSAADLGLARALGRNGIFEDAQEAYARAVAGLADVVTSTKDSPDDAEALDETVLAMLDAAIEERMMLHEAQRTGAQSEPPPEVLAWAESERLFDGDDDEDWARFTERSAVLHAIDGALDTGLQLVDRLATFAPLTDRSKHRARSVTFEAAGDFAKAAEEAILCAPDPLSSDVAEALRTADLLSTAGRDADNRGLLEKLKASSMADLKDDPELVAIVEAIDERLKSTEPPLVQLGLRMRLH